MSSQTTEITGYDGTMKMEREGEDVENCTVLASNAKLPGSINSYTYSFKQWSKILVTITLLR